MNKINYQRELDQILAEITAKGEVPTLLLHSCCAPCSSYVLEYLSQYFKITVFYYNPNIYPESEYTKRILEQQKLIEEMHFRYPVSFLAGKYDRDRFYEMAEPYIKAVIKKDLDLKKIAAMVKTRIEIFPDIVDMVDFFETLPEYDTAMYAHKKMKTTQESSLEVLSEVLPILEEQEDYSNDALYATLLSYVEKKGCKNGYVMWPIRTAVSGRQMTPAGATEIMEIIGKEESLARIRTGIRMLQDSLNG